MEILYSNNLPKVIHTWVSDAPIWKEEAYIQMASALSVLKHYGYIHFYGDKNSIVEVKKLGIPYSSYELIEKQPFGNMFALPKLQVYSKFDNSREYIHLDTDTVLFKKIDFKNFRSPFVFSHCDKYMEKTYDNSRESYNKLLHSMIDPSKEEHFYSQLYLIYLKPFLELSDKIPPHIVKSTDIWSIPNMNVVYVKKGYGELFAKATNFVMEFYERNRDKIEGYENGACFIEQFLIHQHLRSSDWAYKEESDKLEHLLKHRNPLNQLEAPKTRLNDVKFPLRFSYQHPRCSGCNNLGPTGIHEIHSKDEVRKLFHMDFGDSLHFTHMVWYEWWQCYVIDHIVRNYGVEFVKKVHNKFDKGNGKVNLSAGEKLYEEITGNRIFTK